MSYIVSIGGVDKKVQAQSLTLNAPANGRSTLSIDVVSEDGSYRPAMDAEVILRELRDGIFDPTIFDDDIFDDLEDVTVFGGTIDDILETGAGGQPIAAINSKCSVTDFNGYADQRYVAETIPAGTLKAALTVLVDYLTDYGVTLDPAQVDGPALPDLVYDYRKLSDVLGELVTLTGGAYVWEISPDKVLSMYLIGSRAAPFSIEDGDHRSIRDFTVHTSRVNASRAYANRVIVRGGSAEVPITAQAEDAVEIAAHGLWEIVVAAPTATDLTTAQALADELLVQYLVSPKTVEYQTLEHGLAAGQVQTIVRAARNVNNSFMLVDITTRVEEQKLVRRVKAIEGSVYQGSWRDLYKQWSSGVSQVVAVPGTSGAGRQAFFLGGSAIEYVQSSSSWVPVDGTVADPGLQVTLDTSARGSVDARVTVRLRATAGDVQARLRNVSDDIVVGTSSVVASPTFQTVSFAVVLTPGSKIYQLELLPSIIDTDVAGIGYLE